jgi:hypothetical protein
MYLLSIKLIYISKIRINIILLKKYLFLDIWAGPIDRTSPTGRPDILKKIYSTIIYILLSNYVYILVSIFLYTVKFKTILHFYNLNIILFYL